MQWKFHEIYRQFDVTTYSFWDKNNWIKIHSKRVSNLKDADESADLNDSLLKLRWMLLNRSTQKPWKFQRKKFATLCTNEGDRHSSGNDIDWILYNKNKSKKSIVKIQVTLYIVQCA